MPVVPREAYTREDCPSLTNAPPPPEGRPRCARGSLADDRSSGTTSRDTHDSLARARS
jgi:hypothetical protein